MELGISTRLNTEFDDAIAKTRAALQEQGFGVLTEIDMQATLKAKIGAEMERYVILGACNPQLATVRSGWTGRSVCCCRATSWSVPTATA